MIKLRSCLFCFVLSTAFASAESGYTQRESNGKGEVLLNVAQASASESNGGAEVEKSSVITTGSVEKKGGVPPVVHPKEGEMLVLADGVNIKLVGKLQNYYGSGSDGDILSPKSVNIHPSGKKFYVNSLEGGKTLVYSLPALKKLGVIDHIFSAKDSALWAPSSGLFKFRHYTKNLDTFMGKPVESAFSHGGRYLWVPYYRRSFDLNAQDPSAIAVIDTETDTIVRMMEAGVLPKMVAVSPDGKTLAIAHWGDNTVGLIDISSSEPKQWKYKANVVIGRQLFHNFSLTESVDRDSNTGEALRGTVFSPDGRFLFVGCMSGGGIAVINLQSQKYVGKILGLMPNVRHLVIRGNWLYASINKSGLVQRIPVGQLVEVVESMDGSNVVVSGWESVKVSGDARTLELSPKGDYIFVACNSGSALCVVDSTMKSRGQIPADSYPVGLDISPDGRWLITTSQGRQGHGGNCVDIFQLTGLETDFIYAPENEVPQQPTDSNAVPDKVATNDSLSPLNDPQLLSKIGAVVVVLALIAAIGLGFRHRKRKNH
nr:peptidoglycan-binding protein [Bacteroides sp.]